MSLEISCTFHDVDIFVPFRPGVNYIVILFSPYDTFIFFSFALASGEVF